MGDTEGNGGGGLGGKVEHGIGGDKGSVIVI